MKTLWNRYLAPLMFLGGLVYIAFEPIDDQDGVAFRQLRVDSVDPKSIQTKMSQMHRETTQLKYQPGAGEPKNKYVTREYNYPDHVDPFPNDGSVEPSSSSSITIVPNESLPKGKAKLTDDTNTDKDEEKEEESSSKHKIRSNLQTEQAKRDKLLYSRNKNILTLGGSTTWGSKLDKRESAYPYLLPEILGPTWRVTNLAVRATDASYASQCIESMIREGGGDAEFDVILLEYSLNGLDGLPLLVRRLHQRFPQAIIIYIHLWSLRMTVDNAVTGAKPRDELNKGLKFKDADASINSMLNDASTTWTWAPKMKSDSEAIAALAKEHVQLAGDSGYLYSVPMPESPQVAFTDHWFGPDYHHLSEQGHQLVAHDIAQMLQDNKIMAKQTVTDIHNVQLADQVGTWGDGDHCYSWYETGQHPDVQVEGGTMKMFVKPDKYAVNIGLSFGQPATFTFPNRKSVAQPVMLMIMSWGPGVYPKSQIDLVSPNFDNQTSTLDPLHPNPLNHVFHVTRTAHVGWANRDSKSSITVNPLEDEQRPLRVIGIVMCGACIEMDGTYLNNDSTHQRLGGTLPLPVDRQEERDQRKQQKHQKRQNGPDGNKQEAQPEDSQKSQKSSASSAPHQDDDTTPRGDDGSGVSEAGARQLVGSQGLGGGDSSHHAMGQAMAEGGMPPHRRSSDPQSGSTMVSYQAGLDPNLLPHRGRRTAQTAMEQIN